MGDLTASAPRQETRRHGRRTGRSMGGTVVVPPIDLVRQTPATTVSEAVLEVIRECGVRSLFGSPILLEHLAC